MSYLKGAASTRATPQSEPVPGRTDQVENYAGGHVFAVDSMERLRRFLILGSEGGTYYAGEGELTRDNAKGVLRALDDHGPGAVAEIASISEGGRAPKNDPAIFALAIAAAHRDPEVRAAALLMLPRVCRTATHLFQFCELVEDFRGWGRALKRAVGRWYLDKEPEKLAYQLIKYRQRNGWTHRDVLALSKPKPIRGGNTDALLCWAVGKRLVQDPRVGGSFFAVGPEFVVNGRVQIPEQVDLGRAYSNDERRLTLAAAGMPDGGEFVAHRIPSAVEAFVEAQASPSAAATAKLIREHGSALPREALQTEHLNDADVWRAQLEVGMPITALLRNLATMTRNGTLVAMGGEHLKLVTEALTDQEKLVRGRVHPIAILSAMMTYQSGRSFRGDSTWLPIRQVVDALDAAFYLAFDSVESSGKRTLIGLDVSGSMTSHFIGSMPLLSARAASAAMALVTMRVEDPCLTVAFTSADGAGFYGTPAVTPVDISPRQRLDDVIAATDGIPFGRTDCALPMLAAIEQDFAVDTFIIYTDNETWHGAIHPFQALQRYRDKSGIDAKLIVVGMTSTGFSIADTSDAGMMDVVGFDTAAPAVMTAFSAGRL